MPELPEVEALRISLEDKITSQKILNSKVIKPKIVSGKGNKRQAQDEKTALFEDGSKNKTIKSITRRAKNLTINLDDESMILIHLKMTGQLVYKPHDGDIIFGGHPIKNSDSDPLPSKHTAIIWELERGRLFYNDVRMFGYCLWYKNREELKKEKHYDKIGLEPFDPDFTSGYFYQELKKKKKSIKKSFLDQDIVVGIGNIYADETCHNTGILPTRLCNKITKNEADRLYQSIQNILSKAISMGGSSVANYLLGDGSKGNYAREHKVYKRSGKDCYKCSSDLETIKHAGRTTVYCPKCQN